MQTYLVTGASGYIASWIVKFLLEKGEKVYGTVRSLNNVEKISHLLVLQKKYPDQLMLFEADLLNKESFKAAMKGCSVVLHTASPFIIGKTGNVHRDLIRPALEGTRNVLTLANDFKEVRRVVLTSSVAAVYSDAADLEKTSNGVFTEADWNTLSNEKHNPYQFSKTIAECEAWRIAGEQTRWKLTVINPGLVLGPSLSKRTDSTSIGIMRSLTNGKFRSGVPDLYFGIVDVRDVAKAHILAASSEHSDGRHICVSETLSLISIAKILRDHFPDLPVPKSVLPKIFLYLAAPLIGFTWKFIRLNAGFPFRFDNQKSIQLGLEYSPVGKTIIDHARQLLENDLV